MGYELPEEVILFETKYKLPQLIGSEKQVIWARKIRVDKMKAVRDADVGFREDVQALEQETDATFWIEHRFVVAKKLCEIINDKRNEDRKREAYKTLMNEAKNEVLLAAEDAIDQIAEVSVISKHVCVYMKRNEDIRKFLKSRRFEWNGYCWKRVGNVHLAAEIADELLNKQIKVSTFNEQVRELLLTKTFEKEKVRVIDAHIRESGKHQFKLTFPYNKRISEVVYNGLSGSKHNGAYMVHRNRYRDIQDFADEFDFHLTDEAKKLIELLEQRLVVPVQKKQQVQLQPEVTEDGVLLDLVDED